MLTIERSLNIYAAGIPQIISLSQYDDDFRLVFTLYTSEGEFTIPSGTTAEVMGTKVDGNGYSATASISGSTVTVTGNKQMTACAGRNVYEIVLTQSGKRLATVNFILKVERAALDADTIQSETVLKELNAIIDSAATATEAAETATAAAESAAESARTLTIDPTLTQSGQAADAKIVGDEINGLKEDLRQKTGLSEEAKFALLNCFQHVAWIDEHGQTYYDNLYDALYPESALVRLKAVFTQGSAVVYPTTPLDDLKAYLTVTGYYNDGTSGRVTDYALSGTLSVGTSTVTVIKDGKTTTFNVTVSQPYWDYEWYANSKTFPTYMTADYYDFTTENGAMFIKKPVLDFNYVGNGRLQIEMRAYSEGAAGVQEFKFCNNPQICIQNAVISTDPAQYRGVKIVLDSTLGTSDEHGMAGINVNGTNTLIPNTNSNIYHVYDLTAQNNVYTGSIDGSSIEITQNTETTPYINRTGISSGTPSEGFYGAFIKSIKFKRL